MSLRNVSLAGAGLTALALVIQPASAEQPTRDQCDAAYGMIYDAQGKTGPDGEPLVSEAATDWAVKYQDSVYRGKPNPCTSLPPDLPQPAQDTPEIGDSLEALKQVVAEMAFKTARAHIREGNRSEAITKFRQACGYDHADSCYAFATYHGIAVGDLNAPEAVAAIQKACRLGNEAACSAEDSRTGQSR